MDDKTLQELQRRNRRIIDAVIEKSKTVCPGSLALIGICGSFSTGDAHERSDLDLLILINDDTGWKLSSCFILGEVAHDLYCTTWASLEEMAQVTQPHLAKLMDSRIVHCSDEASRARFEALRARVARTLSEPLSPADLQKAERFVTAAAEQYARVMIADEPGACRFAAAQMLERIECALYMLNKTYVRHGIRRIPEELGRMGSLPEGFMERHDAVVRAASVADLREACTALYQTVRVFFDLCGRKIRGCGKAPDAETYAGSYEEIYSNWKNKMRQAAKTEDPYLSLMTAASCQNFYDELSEAYDLAPIRLMADFCPEDLAGNVRAFDRAMEAYRELCRTAGTPVRAYRTIEEFKRGYLLSDENGGGTSK